MKIEEIIGVIGPEKFLGTSVSIDMGILANKNVDIANYIISNNNIFYGIEGDISKKFGKTVRLRPYNLPQFASISDIMQQKHDNGIAQFKGIVTQILPVKRLYARKVYRCKFCKHDDVREADTVDAMLDLPKNKSMFGRCRFCHTKAPKELIAKECIFVPAQRIVIQETIDNTRPGHVPSKIVTWALDDLASDRVSAADQVVVVGAIHPDTSPSQTASVYSELLSIIKTVQAYEDIKITVEDINKFGQISKDPELYDKLVKSFAPTIYGYKYEKMALLCSLFGAPRIKSDSTDIRGDIHILLTGDPGLAKSMMVQWACKVSTRGVPAGGTRASGAGLTVAWSRGKDDVPELLPGAMVLADGGGLVAIDEIDKVDKKDLLAIHGPMEQQVIEVAMAGAKGRFPARCSVCAAANPISGRYDPMKTIQQNVGLDPALLSRFDLIFVMRDSPTLATEAPLARHMLKTHSGQSRHAPIDIEILRKYIAYARRIEPDLISDSEASKAIYDAYLTSRLNQAQGAIKATPRQLEALIRLSKAVARMRLSQTVEKEDTQKAIELMAKSAKPRELDTEEVGQLEENLLSKKQEQMWERILKEVKDGKLDKQRVYNLFFGQSDIVDDLMKKKRIIGDKESWIME